MIRFFEIWSPGRIKEGPVQGSKIAFCIDTKTTGLDHEEDKIVELGIVAFEYNPETAEIVRITGRYSGFEDPGSSISEEVKEITGITDEMVSGQRMDDDQVNALARQATLVIAHNAAFDRKFVESRFPVFADVSWGCSVSQVNWQAERISSRTLEYLLYKCGGWCFNPHRAMDDAEGLLGLLLGQLPVSGTPIFRNCSKRQTRRLRE